MFKAEDLQEYFDKSSGPHIGFKGPCHNCGKPVCVDIDMANDGRVTVQGGALYKAQVGQTGEDTAFFLKCDTCFKKNYTLTRFQPCEVYSRVIGYLRPVSDWNEGKQEEYKMRKTFEV